MEIPEEDIDDEDDDKIELDDDNDDRSNDDVDCAGNELAHANIPGVPHKIAGLNEDKEPDKTNKLNKATGLDETTGVDYNTNKYGEDIKDNI